jgi:MinD-like ATPase involved in chromosome partitioning or flagellar assembly
MLDDITVPRTPRTAEDIPVVLARMEGKLDRVQDRVVELIPRVNKIEERLKVQEDMTLVLSMDAAAEEAKKIALALALKEADETRRNQSEQTWTPVQRFMAVLACIVGAVSLAIYLYSTINAGA